MTQLQEKEYDRCRSLCHGPPRSPSPASLPGGWAHLCSHRSDSLESKGVYLFWILHSTEPGTQQKLPELNWMWQKQDFPHCKFSKSPKLGISGRALHKYCVEVNLSLNISTFKNNEEQEPGEEGTRSYQCIYWAQTSGGWKQLWRQPVQGTVPCSEWT